MKHLTDENIEDLAGQYVCLGGILPLNERGIALLKAGKIGYYDGYKACQDAWQPKPIEELDKEYRGAIILYNNKKMELHIIGYIDEYITIQKYYTHFFIPPTLKQKESTNE